MSILVDTNVLLRRAQPGHPMKPEAVRSVARLIEDGESVCFTFQNIAEFWNVASRPQANNGLGQSIEFVQAEVELFKRELTLLPDSPAIFTEWMRIVVNHRVMGTKVHDAKLVAAMRVHNVQRILMFNTGDFARYGVDAVHPSSI